MYTLINQSKQTISITQRLFWIHTQDFIIRIVNVRAGNIYYPRFQLDTRTYNNVTANLFTLKGSLSSVTGDAKNL